MNGYGHFGFFKRAVAEGRLFGPDGEAQWRAKAGELKQAEQSQSRDVAHAVSLREWLGEESFLEHEINPHKGELLHNCRLREESRNKCSSFPRWLIIRLMRRRRKTVFVLGLMVVLTLAWVVFTPEKEPEYQGKKLSEWLLEFRTGGEWKKAHDAIQIIGTNAIPLLLDWIAYEPPESGDRTDGLLNTIRVNWRTTSLYLEEVLYTMRLHRDPPEALYARRRDALTAFQILGPIAEPAVPALSQLLYDVKEDDELNAQSLALALARVSPTYCAPLYTALTNRNLAVRVGAAITIARSRNTNSAAAVPILVDYVHHHKHGFSFFSATHALGSLHCRPELSLPALNSVLTNPDPSLRKAAVIAIGEFESEARTNLQFVLPLLRDTDPTVRESATNVIRRIDPNALPRE